MALDKLVDSGQLDSDLTSVANAIRTKGGTSSQLAFPAGFVSAVQAIPTGGTPTGTKQISITANGTTTEDVAAYANAEITVNVQGGGGYTAADFADLSKPTGEVVYDADSVAMLPGRTEITKLYLPNWTGTSNTAEFFSRMKKLAYAVFPAQTRLYNNGLANCENLIGVDLYTGYLGSSVFANDTKFKYLVIRKGAVSSLGNSNSFNNTPFASGKAGGILYVPASLISNYQSATNWSTILGYANNQIKSIESTATDPDAPVDLTTHYIDGTPIPTT